VGLLGLHTMIALVSGVIDFSKTLMRGSAKPSLIFEVMGFTTTPAVWAKAL